MPKALACRRAETDRICYVFGVDSLNEIRNRAKMVGQQQALRAPLRRFVPQRVDPMSGLWRLLLWGGIATSALLIAVLAGRGDTGSERAAAAVSSLGGGASLVRPDGPAAPQKFDAAAEARRLAEAVHGLQAENEQLKTRLAAVEHSMDDITGSITKEIEAVKAAAAERTWPTDDPPVPATPAVIASVVQPEVPPPSGVATPLPPNPLTPPARSADGGAPPVQYAIDIGSALNIQALRARWMGIHSAHPDLFDGLQAVATLKELPRSNKDELRLVVGPLPDADAAARLCATLASYRVFCQPAIYDKQHLALQ
jgi:hypothetical protein